MRWPPALVFFSLLIFILAGLAFIPQAGIEEDEAMLVSGMYPRDGFAQTIGHNIPLMLMGYVGALKSWIYAPLFLVWEPTAFSLRLPAILAGGFTIWPFCRLLRRIAGDRAAAIGARAARSRPRVSAHYLL